MGGSASPKTLRLLIYFNGREGELFLAAYLATLPLHRYIGTRVVELGSGPGLIGLMLAKLGAKV